MGVVIAIWGALFTERVRSQRQLNSARKFIVEQLEALHGELRMIYDGAGLDEGNPHNLAANLNLIKVRMQAVLGTIAAAPPQTFPGMSAATMIAWLKDTFATDIAAYEKFVADTALGVSHKNVFDAIWQKRDHQEKILGMVIAELKQHA